MGAGDEGVLGFGKNAAQVHPGQAHPAAQAKPILQGHRGLPVQSWFASQVGVALAEDSGERSQGGFALPSQDLDLAIDALFRIGDCLLKFAGPALGIGAALGEPSEFAFYFTGCIEGMWIQMAMDKDLFDKETIVDILHENAYIHLAKT